MAAEVTDYLSTEIASLLTDQKPRRTSLPSQLSPIISAVLYILLSRIRSNHPLNGTSIGPLRPYGATGLSIQLMHASEGRRQ